MTTKTQAHFQKLVAKYTPRGWDVVQTETVPDGAWGSTDWRTKTIFCEPVTNTYSLHVFLHEVAHVKLHRTRKDRYVEEYEAEMWSFAAMVQEGFPVTRKMIKLAKENVYQLVATTINMEAVKWSITK